MKHSILKFSILCGLLFFFSNQWAKAQGIIGTWYNQEKTAKVQIYEAKDDHFYGKIVWLKEPNENGKPKVDKNNPDKAKQSTPLMNLLVLKHFKKKSETQYEGGTIYDPKNGKTYDCKMTLKGDKLDIRGYVKITLIGRTSTWTRAN